MKALVILGTGIFASATSQAADSGNVKVTGQIRLDHISSNQTVKQGDISTKSSEGSFKLNRARLVIEGNADQDISYRIKFYLDRAQDPDVGSGKAYDGINKGLVEAKLVHKITDMFSLEIGRLELNTMSIEAYYNSMDIYSAAEATLRKPGSGNGAAAVGKFADQTLTLQVTNSPGYDADGKGTYKTSNNDMTAALQWQGSLVGGMVKPVVSYGNIRRRDCNYVAATATAAAETICSEAYNQSYAGVGTSLIFGGTTIELEWDAIDNPKYKADKSVDAKSKKYHNDIGVASVRQKLTSKLLGIIKYDSDKEKLDTVKTDTQKTSLAFEFRPNENTLRYHINYEFMNKKVTEPSKDPIKTTKSTLLVGAGASI